MEKKGPAAGSQRLLKVGREMSRILRHQPPAGAMDKQGWVPVPTLIAHMKSKPSYAELVQAVATDNKGRFVLDEACEPPRIRAAQGHSVQVEEPVLEPVQQADAVEVAIHITSKEGWQAVQTSGELRSMSRTHIHFATQPGHLRKNKWADTLLILKLQEALDAGFKFYLSSNQVLLCEGPLPVQFVECIERSQLPQSWQPGDS